MGFEHIGYFGWKRLTGLLTLKHIDRKNILKAVSLFLALPVPNLSVFALADNLCLLRFRVLSSDKKGSRSLVEGCVGDYNSVFERL